VAINNFCAFDYYHHYYLLLSCANGLRSDKEIMVYFVSAQHAAAATVIKVKGLNEG
jgi:hypothetical protein